MKSAEQMCREGDVEVCAILREMDRAEFLILIAAVFLFALVVMEVPRVVRWWRGY